MTSASVLLIVMMMTTMIMRSRSVYYSSGSNLTSIPLEAWPGDQLLDIRDNTIHRISANAFISYSDLRRLVLIGVGVQYIEKDAFRGQHKLEVLSIIGSGRMLVLPSDLGPPTKSLIAILLWSTFSSNTEIAYPYFKAFEKLESLNLGGNYFTPPNHFLPKNLTLFYAMRNWIPIFPNLGIAPWLLTISLHSSGMNSIPVQNVVGLTGVTSLNLHSNRLSDLPDISFMKNLEYLGVHNNELATMPDLYELPLTTLTLADNPLVCDRVLCWIRMWPWMKASTIPSDEPTCAGTAAKVGMRLMDVDPVLMECFKGGFLHNMHYLSFPGVKL